MANSLLTASQITRESIRLFTNSNAFIKNVDRQYDASFGKTGAKIGSALRIRLPNDYVVRRGPTAVPQDTVEQQTSLTVSSQLGVDMSFGSAELTLSLDEFSKRVIRPAINTLLGGVAADVMSLAETSPNVVRNAATDGTNATLSPTFSTWAAAGAVLDRYGADRGDRNVVLDPTTQARTVSSFSGLFNDQAKVGQQYRKGIIGTDVIGFDWMMDQTVIMHQTGAYGVLPTVAGAGQSGSSLAVTALAGPLNKGDFIQIALVNGVNRVTKASNGIMATFAVTANVPAGATAIPIYPPITPPVGGVSVPFQTVDAAPANGAQILSPFNAGERYRKNIAMVPEAFTLAMVDLEMPGGVDMAARENHDGVAMRFLRQYNSISDQWVSRFDILYGYAALRPEWAVVVADAV